jgi:tetratricopeptide (TPR) repeat protein
MLPLDYPDRHHLNAAVGWLELGATKEAVRELAQIGAHNLFHPDVLGFRWHLLAGQRAWEDALEVARMHVRAEPKSAEAWIHQSFTLHELQRTDEALTELQRVADRFEDIGTIPYNLACYTCRLGRIEEARTWLKRACKLQGKKATLAMAADDPDLAAIRDELPKL